MEFKLKRTRTEGSVVEYAKIINGKIEWVGQMRDATLMTNQIMISTLTVNDSYCISVKGDVVDFVKCTIIRERVNGGLL